MCEHETLAGLTLRATPPSADMTSEPPPLDIVLRLREAFDSFVGAEIRGEVLERTRTRQRQLQEVTILFADLRNFARWVESVPPQEVADDVSAYFTEMESAVRRHRGLILQFIGDEIEAVFGIPGRCSAHADRAVAAALEMRTRLAALNSRRVREGKIPLRHGIGVHTGTVLAGVIGSAHRRFYALVGDAVNVASRIQELTKSVGSDILVSASTWARIRRHHDFVGIEGATLRGRMEGIDVYRPR